jgi:hypothetical protein
VFSLCDGNSVVAEFMVFSLCDGNSVVAEFMVFSFLNRHLQCSPLVVLGLAMLLGLKPGNLCDAISVVAEFMVDVSNR